MESVFIWLFAIYGFTAVWINWRKGRHRIQQKSIIHYQLYTHNSQGKIEWMIRYLTQLACLEGRSFSLSIFDFGSTDDTITIVEKLRRQGLMIELIDYRGKKWGEKTIDEQSRSIIVRKNRILDLYIIVDLRENEDVLSS